MLIYPNYDILAFRLRVLRMKKRLSQKELGMRSGVGRLRIFCWEHKRLQTWCLYENLRSVAEELGVSAEYLIGLDEGIDE